MTSRFCRNDDGDCPCFRVVADDDEMNYVDNGCVLNPVWEGIEFPERHYCYSGRQIMEQQATWNALKNCYPKKAKDPIGGEWG